MNPVRTPLIEAAINNHADIVTMLLDRRVDVAYKTRLRTTAASLTRVHGNVEIQKVLEMREGLQFAHDALLRAITLSDVEYVGADAEGSYSCSFVPLCPNRAVRKMVGDGEMYKRNHLSVLEQRLRDVITELAADTERESALVAEISAAEEVIRACYVEMYGEGWDKPDDDAPQFGEFKEVVVRPPTPPRVPRAYRGTQGALRVCTAELAAVQENLRYLKAEVACVLYPVWLVSHACVLLQKIALHKRIWVAKLLRFRSFTGHTALAWAASLNCEEIVDVLYTHGANISVDDDVLITSADLIRAAWSYYKWKCSEERGRIESFVLRYTRDALEMVHLLVVLRRRRTIRRSCRVPVCEALYNCR